MVSSSLTSSREGRAQQRYDGETRLLACAVVVYSSSKPLILVISSSKQPEEFILPKGGWELDETVEQCVLREVEEEAGVTGEIRSNLGPLDFDSRKGNPCRLYGFHLQLTQEFESWPETHRHRRWVSIEEGMELLKHRPEMVEMLQRLRLTA